jgi:hypothetical protein
MRLTIIDPLAPTLLPAQHRAITLDDMRMEIAARATDSWPVSVAATRLSARARSKSSVPATTRLPGPCRGTPVPAPKGLGALACINRELAGRRLRTAIRQAGGDLAVARARLDVSAPGLSVWLAKFPGGPVPGGRGATYPTCRAWLDATYPQRHDPRKQGRRRAGEEIDEGSQTGD